MKTTKFWIDKHPLGCCEDELGEYIEEIQNDAKKDLEGKIVKILQEIMMDYSRPHINTTSSSGILGNKICNLLGELGQTYDGL